MNFLKTILILFSLPILMFSCTEDICDLPPLPIPVDTGIDYDGTENFSIIETIENGITVIKLTGIIDENITIQPLDTRQWFFSGAVFIAEGVTVTIKKGTTIYFDTKSVQASAFYVLQGAKINIEGEQNNRVTFTSSNELGSGMGAAAGDWGGLIVNGNATINIPQDSTNPIFEYGMFGGTDDSDNSGNIEYLLVKYSGRVTSANAYLDGISLRGVGTNTNIHHIQSYESDNNGISIYGGTVSIYNAVAINAVNKGFYWSHGWRGNGQFWLAIQPINDGKNCVEGNNLELDYTAFPMSKPILSNLTLICSDGTNSEFTGGILLRYGTKGTIHNAIVNSGTSFGIRAETDGITQFHINENQLTVTNSNAFNARNNGIYTWSLGAAVWKNTNNNLDTIITLNDGIGTMPNGFNPTVYGQSLFSFVDYIGAISTNDNWLNGWAIKPNGSDY
jgi:hypothetical protein